MFTAIVAASGEHVRPKRRGLIWSTEVNQQIQTVNVNKKQKSAEASGTLHENNRCYGLIRLQYRVSLACVYKPHADG